MPKYLETPSFHASEEELPLISVSHSGKAGAGTVSFKMVYGTDTGLMIAHRIQGYHSKPHYHDCEQFNYILDGELMFFIEEEGYLCKPGDIIRVPRNATHWVWVTAPEGCKMLETHTAPLIGDPALGEGAVPLVGPGEDFKEPVGAENTFTDYDKLAEVEAKVFKKYGLEMPA